MIEEEIQELRASINKLDTDVTTLSFKLDNLINIIAEGKK